MKAGLVSVVVPVYNTEKYLDRCIQSIVNQTYCNLEILLIDDESPDACPQMCDDWAKRDNRIKVIHKKNAGLGMARNTGIEHASGEAVCFFDSDDYIALDTVEKSVAFMKKNKSDIVLFGMAEVSSAGTIRKEYCPYTEKEYYLGAEILDFVLPNMIAGSSEKGKHYNLNMSACSGLFSMELITENNWRFVSEREFISEDFYSLLYLYQYVKNVSVLKQVCYFYCHNVSSLTHTFRPDRYERICHCYLAMVEMCEKLQYTEKIKRNLASQFLGNTIGAVKMIVGSSERYSNKMKALRKIVYDHTIQEVLKDIHVSHEGTGRKLFCFLMKNGWVWILYLLIKVKNK